jgi:hypothetical protein
VFALHIVQPVIRAVTRYGYRLSHKQLPQMPADGPRDAAPMKRISATVRDVYWASRRGRGREELLKALEAQAREHGWRGLFHEEWRTWDVMLLGDLWHNIMLHSATEELGGPKRFTRVRCTVQLTAFAAVVSTAVLAAIVIEAVDGRWPRGASGLFGLLALGLLVRLFISRRRSFAAVSMLLGAAGREAGLNPMDPAENDDEGLRRRRRNPGAAGEANVGDETAAEAIENEPAIMARRAATADAAAHA